MHIAQAMSNTVITASLPLRFFYTSQRDQAIE
jgi:hypothetical protein